MNFAAAGKNLLSPGLQAKINISAIPIAVVGVNLASHHCGETG